MKDILKDLINQIKIRCDHEGRWEIKAEEVMTTLRIDPVDFCRTVYTNEGSLPFSGTVKNFTHETVGELISLVEHLTGEAVDRCFTREGLFLPGDIRIDITENFLFAVNRAIAVHRIQYEEMEGMLRHTKNFHRAFLIYLEEYFVLSQLKEEAFEEFSRQHATDEYSYYNIMRYIELLFQKHILDWEQLFYPLYLRLRNIFIIEEQQEEPVDEDLKEALDHLELAALPEKSKVLKEQYKQLMKKYHPDLNPEGLEKSKRINNAYAFLLSRIEES